MTTLIPPRPATLQRLACPHCDDVFATADHFALHLGRRHESQLNAADREAFDAARQREDEWLILVRRHAEALLSITPAIALLFGLVIMAAGAGVNIGFAFLGIPASVFMLGLMYALAISMNET